MVESIKIFLCISLLFSSINIVRIFGSNDLYQEYKDPVLYNAEIQCEKLFNLKFLPSKYVESLFVDTNTIKIMWNDDSRTGNCLLKLLPDGRVGESLVYFIYE